VKRYRLDEDPKNPVPIVGEDEDAQERGDSPKSIWVEQIVKIFGETHYTEKYSLLSRKKLKKLNLWPQKTTNSSIPKTSSTKIQFRRVYPRLVLSSRNTYYPR
jgi:hypothetical protein